MFAVVQRVDFNQKKLFVGDVLREKELSDHNSKLVSYTNLSKTKEFILDPSYMASATNEDVYNGFLIESSGWVAHISQDKLDYVAKIENIDLPYLNHSLGGNDYVYNFIPATDDMILNYKKDELVKSRSIKEGVFIQDDMEIEGKVVGFELDKVKGILIKYRNSAGIIYKCKESNIVKVLLRDSSLREVPDPGDYVKLNPSDLFPQGLIVKVSKTDVNAFYNEEAAIWFEDIDKWGWRRATYEEIQKAEAFKGLAFSEILLTMIEDRLSEYPPNEYNILQYRIFMMNFFPKVLKSLINVA